MSTPATDQTRAPRRPSPPAPAYSGFWAGRSELGFVAVLLGLAIAMTVGTATMKVLGKTVPGPDVFPWIVCVLLYGTAAALTIGILRRPRFPDGDKHPGDGDFSADLLDDISGVSTERTDGRRGAINPRFRTYTDWKTVGTMVAGCAGFVLVLPFLGWVISAAALFAVVAKALGGTRLLFDLGVGLLLSSGIQLALGAGLGLPLPGGFLEGLL